MACFDILAKKAGGTPQAQALLEVFSSAKGYFLPLRNTNIVIPRSLAQYAGR
jgi:hypothetical protein